MVIVVWLSVRLGPDLGAFCSSMYVYRHDAPGFLRKYFHQAALLHCSNHNVENHNRTGIISCVHRPLFPSNGAPFVVINSPKVSERE